MIAVEIISLAVCYIVVVPVSLTLGYCHWLLTAPWIECCRSKSSNLQILACSCPWQITDVGDPLPLHPFG